MKKDGIQTRNRKLSAKVRQTAEISFFITKKCYDFVIIPVKEECFSSQKSVTILLSFQSKKKRAGMADFFRNGLDGRWGMGMGEIIIRCICICIYFDLILSST